MVPESAYGHGASTVTGLGVGFGAGLAAVVRGATLAVVVGAGATAVVAAPSPADRAQPAAPATTSASRTIVTVRTAADYMRDPGAYDAETAWRTALAELGAGAGEAFAVFAAAHRFSPPLPADRDPELESAVGVLRNALDGGGATGPVLKELRALLDARVAAAETLRANLADRRLAEQIDPWLVSHHAESERMAAALELVESLCSDMAPMQLVFAFFRFEGLLTRIAPAAVASYGPRRVLYPQLGSMRDDGAAFGADQSLFIDRCLTDEVLKLAERMALARLSAEKA